MELPPVRFATASDGVRIAYMRWPGESPSLLNVNTPGAPSLSTRTRFGPYIRAVRGTDKAIIWFDWRGSGQSDPRPPECLDELVLDIEAVTDAIGESPDVLAFNLACFPACMFAAGQPNAWRSLVLVDPSTTQATNPAGFLNRPGWETDYLAQLRLISRVFGQTRAEELEPRVQDWAQTVPLASQIAYRSIETAADLTELLPQISTPTIVTNHIGRPSPRVAAALPRALLVEKGEDEPIPPYREIWERHMPMLLSESAHSPPPPTGRPLRLTKREQEVLASLAAGQSSASVAQRLTLSPRTVDRHIANIYAKLGVHNRVEAANWAREHGVN